MRPTRGRAQQVLDYAVNRHYSSGLGRFLQTDPYGGSARIDGPQSWNRYAYVEGDPMNLFDPEGLFALQAPIPPTTFPPVNVYGSPILGLIGGGAGGGVREKTAKPVEIDLGGGPVLCSFSAQSLLSYMNNTAAYTAQGKLITNKPLATLANAQALMAAGANYNVDPRVLLAIGFVEGKWGGDSSAANTNNTFGLMPGGTLASYSSWSASITAAASTVAAHIAAGQTTIASLYSGNTATQNGGLAAYCVGTGCAAKVAILNSKLAGQNNKQSTIANECYLSKGNYYER